MMRFAMILLFMLTSTACGDDDDDAVGDGDADADADADADCWIPERIDGAHSTVETALAIDSAGDAHVVYSDNDNVLVYATNESGAWVTAEIDTGGHVAWSPEIAAEGSGDTAARVCYFDWTDSALVYATRESGAWATTVIAPSSQGEESGRGCAIAVDSQGYEHISYIRYVARYTTNASGLWADWDEDFVDATAFAQFDTVLALDPDDAPWVAYYLPTSGGDVFDEVRVAQRAGGAWDSSMVEVVGSQSLGLSLAVDSTGVPWFSYWNHTDADLRIAHDPGDGWSAETLYDDDDDPADSSLAIDSNDAVHVVHPRWAAGLWHVTNASGAWTSERIDDFGYGASLDADGAGGLHVSYVDADVWYAHCP